MSTHSQNTPHSPPAQNATGVGGLPVAGSPVLYPPHLSSPASSYLLPPAQALQHQYLGEKTAKPRAFGDRLVYEAGSSYLLGIFGGGVIGAYQGAMNPHGPGWKLRMNSIINSSSRLGSTTGNSFAVFALLYSMTRDCLRQYIRETDDPINESIGAFTAGTLVAKGNKFPFHYSVLAGTSLMLLTYVGHSLRRKYDPSATRLVQLPPALPPHNPHQHQQRRA